VTEQEWLTSQNPAEMLKWATGAIRGSTAPGVLPDGFRAMSNRKQRLFACACCLAAGTPVSIVNDYELTGMVDDIGERRTDSDWARSWTERGMNKPTLAQRADLLREIVGNSYRPLTFPRYQLPSRPGARHGLPRGAHPMIPTPDIPGQEFTIRPTWLTPDAIGIAQDAYDSRDWRLLPLLAECLEEAGCVETSDMVVPGMYICEKCGVAFGPDGWAVYCRNCGSNYCRKQRLLDLPHPILAHLRSTVPHVRGCFALDLLLGKE